MTTGQVAHVRTGTDPVEAGRAHGGARAHALRAFVDDDLCRLNRLRRPPLTLAELVPALDAHGAVIDAATPALGQEILGLAEGAGLTRHEALLLQLRREVLGYRSVRPAGDCTTYARLADEPVLAQTVDLNGDLDDQIAVLDTGRALVLSFAGLLGYLGVNTHGLAVGLNLVVGGTWRPGVPPYLAIRHLLDTARDVTEAISLLRDLPLASSRSVMLCDRGRAAYVEILDDQRRVVTGETLSHTNHYLHPDLAPHDELNVFARNSSTRRLDAVRSRLAALPAGAGVADHFALLADPPIRVPDPGDITVERTVATVVLLPARGELHVRPGDGSAGQVQRFRPRAGVPR